MPFLTEYGGMIQVKVGNDCLDVCMPPECMSFQPAEKSQGELYIAAELALLELALVDHKIHGRYSIILTGYEYARRLRSPSLKVDTIYFFTHSIKKFRYSSKQIRTCTPTYLLRYSSKYDIRSSLIVLYL